MNNAMIKFSSLVFLLSSLSACGVTTHGYRGPGDTVAHTQLNNFEYKNGMSIPYIYSGDELDVEFLSVDSRQLDPDLSPPENITLDPGKHKVVVQVTAKKSGHPKSLVEMEFEEDFPNNGYYSFKGELTETYANVWIEDISGRIIGNKLPVTYTR